MKPDIHPDYHEITVIRPSGEKFTTRSTYGKAGDTLHLDVDPATHPAWNKGVQTITTGGQVSRFAKRYEGLSRGSVTGAKTKKAADDKKSAESK